MKKLLSLLSILTISGTAVPTTIAASPYQKEEIINSDINYQQTNNFEKLNRNKREEQNNKIYKTKIVIETKGEIYANGITLNSKLYFGSKDNNVYEYDPATGQQKIVIQTKGQIWTSGVILNNKLYFGSDDYNVYEYDPATEQQKVIITATYWIRSSGIVLNNKLYFGSTDKKVYEYDPATGQQKIVIRTEGEVFSSGINLNNKLYFGSFDYNVYEYDPATGQQKIVIRTEEIVQSSGVVLNSKLYFGSKDNNVYEYDPTTNQQKIVIRTKSGVWSSGVVLNNKVYFGSEDYNVYEYDPATGQQKIVIVTNGWIGCPGLAFNNKLYFGSDDRKIYEYDPATEQQKVIINTEGRVQSSGVVLNNKLYFGSFDYNVYEYGEFYLNSNLGQINDSSNISILNDLNYLNRDLNISQLEIISKTDTSASIKIKNKFNNDVNVINVNYSINNELNKIINLNELIKKAIFFKFRDENSNLKLKEIKYIDINNLNFSNIEVTKKSKLLNGIDYKYPCSDKEVVNRTSNPKLFYVSDCEYNSKSELTFQIRKGIIKNQEKNQENIWTLNSDDENKLIEFIYWNNKDNEIINTLSNDFIFSNLNEQKKEMILNMFRKTDSRFELNPNEKLKINYSVRINKSEIILNLKQKITGIISAKIIDDNNEEKTITLSIKEAMQILQRYNLLPDKININKDNSITFNGEAFLSFKREGQLKTSINTFVI